MGDSRFLNELTSLLEEGSKLLASTVDVRKDGESADSGLDRMAYENWFTRASRVVRQLLPERHEEFTCLYRLPRRPREIDVSTYTISDYMAGIGLVHHDSLNVVKSKFFNQMAILMSAMDVLPSRISDITNVIRADLFDGELAVARELAKRGHLRGAGAVAGVVLERHLRQVVVDRALPLRKKSPTIADVNDLLKGSDVYDVPTWRRIQLLGDLRNLAVHDKERAPTGDEIDELIRGVASTIKSVF